MNPIGFLFIAFGVFTVLGAALDWELFMGHRKARFFVGIMGRGGARVFYGFIGMGLVVLGTLFLAGIIRDTR